MLKKIVIGLALLSSIAILVFLFALWNLNTLVSRYKPALETKIGEALGSQAHLGDIETQVFPVTQLRVREVKIFETAQASGFALRDLVLVLNLRAVLAKRLEITKLALSSPEITLVKDKNGVRVMGVSAGKQDEPAALEKASGSTEKLGDDKKSAQATVAVDLKALEIKNARVMFNDQTSGKSYVFEQLNLEAALNFTSAGLYVHKLALEGNVLGNSSFTVEAPEINLENKRLHVPKLFVTALGALIEAVVSYDLQSKSGSLMAQSRRVDLSKTAELGKDFVPAVSALGLKGQGEIAMDLKIAPGNRFAGSADIVLAAVDLNYQNHQLRELAAKLRMRTEDSVTTVTADSLDFKLNGSLLRGKAMLTLKDQNVELKDITVEAFGGQITKELSLINNGEKPFTTVGEATGVGLQQMLTAVSPGSAGKLSGTLKKLSYKLSGALTGDVKQKLLGSTALQIENGSIKEINLAGEVLKQIKDLPFVSGSLYAGLGPEVRALVDADSTAIKTLTGTFSIAEGRMATRDLHLVSDIFELRGEGNFGFDSSVDINATIFFDRQFVERLMASNKNLQFLADKDGRLVLPLAIKGRLPKVLVLPDVRKLLELGAKSSLRQKAEKELDKLGPGVSELKRLLPF